MNTPLTILMIDDDRDNFDSLKNEAAHNGIILKYVESMEEMIEELSKNLQIDAVILDGKGFLKKGQMRGTEREDFVHEALTQIKLLEQKQNRMIPKCVYTAWYEQLKDGLESRVRVFDKKKLALDKKMKDEFFIYLRNEASGSPSKKIRIKYDEVIAGIGGKYIPGEKEISVIQLLNKVESNDEIKQSDFNSIRELLESIFKRANKIDAEFIPDDMIKNDGRPNLEWCYRYLSGQETFIKKPGSERIIKTYPQKEATAPQHINRAIDYVKHISSMLSHDYEPRWTVLSFKSATLALMEIIIWFKNYIDLKYPNI